MLRRSTVLAAAVTAAAVAVAATGPASAAFASTRTASKTTTTSTTSSRVPVTQLKIMNYYPSDAGWTLMWTTYSHSRTAADFQAIRALGANTVRLVVQPQAVGYPTVTSAMATNFKDALSTAAAAGLSVQLTLFDWWSSYSDLSGSQQWLRSLLAGQSNNPTIALVELQNELATTSSSAMNWATQMLRYLPKVLPGVPRTISPSVSEGLTGISNMLTTFSSSVMEVADVHYYGDAAHAAQTIRTAKSYAAGRPVVVGETGLDTADGAAGEEAQARFFGVVARTARDLGVQPVAPWVLYDFTANGMPYAASDAEHHYGLLRTDGTRKPAAAVVQQAFAGTGTADLDGGFEAEVNGSPDRFGAWLPFAPYYGTASVATDVVRSGTAAMCFSSTTGGSWLPSVYQSLPVLAAGQTVSVAGYVNRTAPSGTERIVVSWFDSAGQNLGYSESSAASTAGTWEPLQVSATAPAGADTVQIHLQAGNESGRACYDDVSISW
jgi:hypothetical protein